VHRHFVPDLYDVIGTGGLPVSRELIVAIDGPSGAGKSSVTALLAKRLGYLHIDTGAMYRALALLVARAGVRVDDDEAVQRVCSAAEIAFQRTADGYQVLVNDDDVSAAIRTPEISLLTSQLASRKVVRDLLLVRQRALGKNGGVVLEGRDIGTVVFPDAEIKFYLTASVEERGRRRFEELRQKGEPVSLAQTIAEVAQRDEQDRTRKHAPLCRAADAVDIDSTGRTLDQVLDEMMLIVAERRVVVGAH
jgi:cytidylate kinase